MRLGKLTLLAIACSLGLPAAGLAADAPPTPAASSNDDSIAAAKRELEQLKRATTAGAIDSRSGTLPSVAIPQVHTDDEPAIIMPPQDPTKLKRKQPSANWLVDGVMNAKRDDEKAADRAHPDRRPARDTEVLSADKSDAHLGSDAEKSLEVEKLTDSPKTADAPPPPRPDTVFNPLSQFMASWMTPQDYSLLRSSADKPTSHGAAEPSPAPSAPGTDSGALAALAGLDGDTQAASKSSYAPIAPAENPFLSGLSLPDAPPVNPAPMAPPPTAQPAPPLIAPPPPPEPEHSTVPDFAKQSDDDKYLKPLKRF